MNHAREDIQATSLKDQILGQSLPTRLSLPVMNGNITMPLRYSEKSRMTIKGPRGIQASRSTRSSSPQNSHSSTTQSCRQDRPTLWAWTEHVPQSVDDERIVFDVQQVFTLAEQYVNNFYTDRLGQRCILEPPLHVELTAFETLPAGVEAHKLIEFVAQPTAMIKHSLVALLLSTISITKDGPYCLLPSSFVPLVRAVNKGYGCNADIKREFSANRCWYTSLQC